MNWVVKNLFTKSQNVLEQKRKKILHENTRLQELLQTLFETI